MYMTGAEPGGPAPERVAAAQRHAAALDRGHLLLRPRRPAGDDSPSPHVVDTATTDAGEVPPHTASLNGRSRPCRRRCRRRTCPSRPREHSAGRDQPVCAQPSGQVPEDRKSTRLNSSHPSISYAVFCLKKKNKQKPSGKEVRKNRYL